MAKAHTLVDNFNDDAIDTVKWFTSATTPIPARIHEINGRVEFRSAGNATSGDYANYESVAYYDLTDSEVSVEVVRTLRPAVNTVNWLIAKVDNLNNISNRIEAEEVLCTWTVAGSLSILRRLPYDPARHRWLRIRSVADTLYWEGSPDRETWTTFHTATRPFAITAMRLQFGAGTHAPVPAPGMAVFDNFNTPDGGIARRVEERRLSARDVRVKAAGLAADRRHDEHANNNDEVYYPSQPFIGNFSKSLVHDALGDPDPSSYATLLRALESRDPDDFERILLASSTALKLTNPQTGLTFDLEGPDPQVITLPPAPRFASIFTSNEAGELYWMAVARDVYFGSYGSDPVLTAAINSLNGEFPQFGGTVPVTAQNVFRGIYPGEQVGPYVSQFLLKGNVDPRKPAGLGRDATDGSVSYGA
jgi:hypothetical protein